MANKKMIIAMIMVFLIALVLLLLVLTRKEEKTEEVTHFLEEAENSIKTKGILQLNTREYSKFKEVIVAVYYKKTNCIETIKGVVKRFSNVEIGDMIKVKKEEKLPDNVKALGSNIEFPIIILKDSREGGERIVNGLAVCSEEILAYNICDSLENPPEFCNGSIFTKTRIKDEGLRQVDDKECYQGCFVEYSLVDNVVGQLWHGPPCERIEGYVGGISHVRTKECLEGSCKSNNQDRACCNKDNCVYENQCYNVKAVYDVDSDSQNEVCTMYENTSLWINPDKDNLSCFFANYNWLDCEPKSECINGINNYGKKEDGLCCGDEQSEFFTKCNGGICYNEDSICCKENQCVYENKCYPSGCVNIKTEFGTKKIYCDGVRNEWIDLDENYCETCLGKESWSGYFCCGDDENEGIYYKELVFRGEIAEKATGKFICTRKKSQCISLIEGNTIPEGCYDVPRIEEGIYGKYYCKKGEWYDADNSKKYCEECDFSWIYAKQENGCCGDDEKEYFIKGNDGTVACCNLNSSDVRNETCYYHQICGNNVLEEGEECEPINTINNLDCNQTTEICWGKKLGIRDKFGDCNNACECSFDKFDYSCIKGKCEAECSNDKDCGAGNSCNMGDCRCYEVEKSTKIDSCPYRVYLKVNKAQLYINDTFILEINIYNKNNELMPNEKFWLDITVNDEPIGASIYSTDETGTYIIEKFITQNTPSGLFEYIVKSTHKDCPLIVGSIKAEFIIELPKASKKTTTEIRKLTKETKKEVITRWDVKEVDFEKPLCGNDKIEIGEACEGDSICRNSLGCNYEKNRYDLVEYCNNCQCPDDLWSKTNSNEYCENCKHCGDNMLNCGELCDNETIYSGNICKDDRLYTKIRICKNCIGYENITSETPVDECFCDCLDNPQENCFNGNYISYTKDYFSGCNDKCNECKCEDTYTKDSNNDGIEDKCSDELCGNGIDDNDNGIIDEKECIWYYCSQCGHNLLNLCDKEECSNLKEGCFFEKAIFRHGLCPKCSLLSSCEDYSYNKDNCIEDPCNLGLCFWNNFTCCTDIDNDKICDYNDNCPKVFNPLQEDIDNDGRGDKCEFCNKEQYLFYPQEQNETYCNDTIDNDCDYLIDCEDNNCFVPCTNISQGVVNGSK